MDTVDERSHLRKICALMSLGGMAACDIADKLGLDPSDLRRRLKNDVEEIERRIRPFLQGKQMVTPKMATTRNRNSDLL